MSDIKIVIGAEVAGAEAGLRRVQGELSKTAVASNASATALNSFASNIKGLGSSLISGGILTGVALLSAGLIKLISSFFEASEETNRLKKANEELSNSFLKAADDAAQEISKVTVLKEVLDSENSTRLQKITALEQLKKINYDYFGQLDIEKGKVIGLDKAYEGYVQKLIRSINAKANVSILTDALEKQARALAKINQNVSAGKLKFQAENLTEFQVQDAIRRFGLSFGAGKGQSVIIDFDQKKLIADLLNAEDEIKGVTKLIKENVQDAFNPKPEKPLKVAKELESEIERVLGSVFAPGKVKAPDGPSAAVDLAIVVKPTPVFDNSAMMEGLQNWIKEMRLDEFREAASAAISTAVQDIVVDALSSTADAIAETLSTGKDFLPNLFGALIKGIGSQLKELGKYLTKIGVEMLFAKKAIEKLKINPAVAIVAGVALQILGGVLTAQANKKFNSSFATGVRNFGGGTALVGERGPEMVYLPKGSSVQPNNELNAYGGGQMVFIPDITLRGTDLVIAFNRASDAMGRNN